MKKEAVETEEMQTYIGSLQKDLAARKLAAAAPPLRVADASAVAPWAKTPAGPWQCCMQHSASHKAMLPLRSCCARRCVPLVKDCRAQAEVSWSPSCGEAWCVRRRRGCHAPHGSRRVGAGRAADEPKYFVGDCIWARGGRTGGSSSPTAAAGTRPGPAADRRHGSLSSGAGRGAGRGG